MDMLKTKYQPAVDNLDEAAQHRNPTDLALATGTTPLSNLPVITWVKEHLAAL